MEKIIGKALVSTRGQIAIPKSVRDKLGVDEGDYIVFVDEGDKIVIKTGKIVVQ